jgi:hypothetical protein
MIVAGLAIATAGCGSTAARSAQDAPVDQTAPVAAAPSRQLAIPYRVMFVGDGVMTDADPGLRAAAESLGPIQVNDQAYWGFAISKPDWYDWRTKWRQLIDTYDPDAVVALFGVHDTYAHVVDGVTRDPASPEWPDWYRSQITAAMDILTARLANVYWIGMLPVGDPAESAVIVANNAIIRQVVASYPTGRFLEPDPAFGSDRGNAQVIDPATGLALRKDDGVHMCATGAGMLGLTLATAIAHDLHIGVGRSFLTGDWRSTDSYLDHAAPTCLIPSP